MTRLVYDEMGQPTTIFRLVAGSAQDVAVGVASAQSTAFASTTTAVRIATTTACRYRVGANPTATATDTYMPAGSVEYVGCQGGDKIAVIQESAGGILNITEAE